MRRTLVVIFASLLISAPSIAASPIQNLVDVRVPIRTDGGHYTIEQVRAAVIKGTQSRLWSAEVSGSRSIRAKLNVKNKHFAVVEIPYSESAYSIIYVSSENLDYNPAKQSIHGNYNKWVVQLSTLINEQLRSLASADIDYGSRRVEAGPDMEDIFNELLNLDDLRDRGIITDEKFEFEKRQLLERL